MTRSNPLATGLLSALLSAAATIQQPIQQPPPPKGGAADTYLGIMLLYRQGEWSRAGSELKSWKPDEITTAVDELKQFSTPEEDLWAAILLHTELGVTAPFRGDLKGKDFHLQVTSELIQMTNERAGLHRRWLLAMGYYYLSQLEEDLAVASFERALELFPNDGQILVALGSVRETMSLLQGSGSSETLDSTDGALPPTNSSEYRSMVAKMRDYSVSHSQLDEAETFYRKALELDHANAEAHLRLGRVLQQSGQEDEALQELSWVIENSSNSSYKGTAHLFKGRVLEGRQQYGDALLHFREAVRWQPNWQTAQIALGHALHRAGERRSSKQIIEEAFRPKKRSRQGGLWQYYFCRDRFIDGIRRMRREILL